MRKIFAVTLLFIVFGARAQTKPTPQPAEQRKQWVQALELVLAEAETETQDLDLSAAERKLLLAKNRAKASDGREILGEDVDLLEEGPPDAKKVVFVFEDQEPRTHYGADTIWMIGDPRKDEVGAGILYACGIAKLRDGDEASTKLMRVLHAKLRQAKQQ